MLDTNVLLSHLSFLEELKDYTIKGADYNSHSLYCLFVEKALVRAFSKCTHTHTHIHTHTRTHTHTHTHAGVGKPVLVIPWAVMHELDHQKSRGSSHLARKARRGIRLLFSCFTSRHPRVRCQTMEEVSCAVVYVCRAQCFQWLVVLGDVESD